MSAIYKNGTWYGKGGGDTSSVELTQLEYDALTEEEKNNGTVYYITDAQVVSNFTVLGNRFDKANIYTADERMIGSYLGKPLYQKSYTNLSIALGTDWVNAIDVTSMDIDVCIECMGLTANNAQSPLCTKFNNNNLQIYMNGMAGVSVTALTIKYTKSSDGTVSIGTGNDYSTDEQIIGTWIDGKKLYQKTIDFGKGPNATTKSVAHNISNFDKCVNVVGYNTDATYYNPIPNSYYANSRVYNTGIDVTSTQVTISSDWNMTARDCYIILQYTKTTD